MTCRQGINGQGINGAQIVPGPSYCDVRHPLPGDAIEVAVIINGVETKKRISEDHALRLAVKLTQAVLSNRSEAARKAQIGEHKPALRGGS